MNLAATTENASLTSNRSISSAVIPALARTLLAAGPGSFSISVGLPPTVAIALTRALGCQPTLAAYSFEAMMIAAAPSTTPEELPAWWM